jgi:fructose-1,6-bisphosphatase
MATSGNKKILDIEPDSITQRVPFYAGNSNLVKELEETVGKD